MNKENIMKVYDDLWQAHADYEFSIHFITNKNVSEKLPVCYIICTASDAVTVPYYMTENDCNTITVEELESAINTILTQERLRRKVIFANAIGEKG